MNYRIFFTLSLLVSAPILMAWTSAPEKSAEASAPTKTESRAVTKREGNHITLSSEAEFDELIASGKLVVVDFFAVWCGPCKNFAPTFEKIAAEFPDVIFVKADVDQFNAVATKQGVRAMPTVIFYQDGKEIKRFSGAKSASELRKELKNLGA